MTRNSTPHSHVTLSATTSDHHHVGIGPVDLESFTPDSPQRWTWFSRSRSGFSWMHSPGNKVARWPKLASYACKVVVGKKELQCTSCTSVVPGSFLASCAWIFNPGARYIWCNDDTKMHLHILWWCTRCMDFVAKCICTSLYSLSIPCNTKAS
jgi:hypothetical protein